ncbi:hypothetical protein ACFP1I_22160 [Dyadobacter subterraneus]|uniref:Histone deacetylase n=1 Tax=Dyadobacter subterraneus TaxID=2773304 RepID=A0ABR9WJD5_9BACT|nr:hypothetical protein [Dyadobacter subterraneus]MBE9465527.1 hypothetical protein [Dyadobacter subterraneus]
MTNLDDKVWYACYGSNILEERFLCYIRGGQPNGSKKNYEGCSDKTLPADSEDFYICSELYFARKSKSWDNGGVAFVKTIFDPQIKTIGRLYLVTKGQLIDIAKQETGTENNLVINFDAATRDGAYIFKKASWYGNLVYLGKQYGYQIFTLTSENDLQPLSKPSKDYLKTISLGIKEVYNFNDQTILEYLNTKGGIVGNYSDQELLEIII